MSLGPTELILILVIVVILFGVGRISKIGKEMGSGIRGFRDGLQGDDKDNKKEETIQKSETSDTAHNNTPPDA
jgi:sec-independent protein translocase protein TatA